MADINVVPKKRTSVWLWIMVAIVVALIAWAIMSGTNTPMQPVSRLDPGLPHLFAESLSVEVVGPAAHQAA